MGISLSAAAAAAAIAASATTVATEINSAVNAPGSGPLGGGGSDGGGLSVTQAQYASQGPAPGKYPSIGGSQEPAISNGQVKASQATRAKPATAYDMRVTPTQGSEEEESMAKSDFQNIWADRLSHYLDYNTRNLG